MRCVLIVTGGRDFFPRYGWLSERLCGAIDAWNVTEMVHGGAKGLDSAADVVVERSRPEVSIKRFPYPSQHGRAGGPIRNREMAQYAAAADRAICVAFTGGRGTQNMIDEAKKVGIEVLDWRGREAANEK